MECCDFNWLLLSIVVGAVFFFTTLYSSYWYKLGVRCPWVPKPLFGHFFESIIGKKHVMAVWELIYQKMGDQPFVGVYNMRTPQLVIKDIDLINCILVKDFNHFNSRGINFDVRSNPLHNNIFVNGGERWRIMRQKMSPGFTFNKLKYMIDQIKECIDCLKLNIDKIVKEESGEIEIRDMMSKYSTDVIGSCAFGLKLDAINDPDSEFRKYGKAVVTPSIRNQIISAILLTQPLLLRILPKNKRRRETISFFKNAFQQTIQYREKNGIDRKDFVEQLMKAREDLVLNPESKNSDVTFSEMDIVANAYILFIAGFDTVSTTLTCALYELALNSTIQNRVREEIQCEKLKNDGQLNHEFLSNLTYMHMVIKETLRKHPPLGILERVVTEPYKIPGSNVTLENGTKIIIPIRSIQHDPKYYSNPDEFDPERFSKENESNLYPNTYYPFGDGPRLCLGKRFAELEMKIALSEILSNFEILPYEKTQIPLQYIIGSFVNAPENVWLIFKPINT